MAENPEAEEKEESGRPHAFWSGTITFGLVSVPVDLYPAVQSRRTPLRTFGPDGQPLKRRYVCSTDGEPLERDEIARGYEWADGSFSVVSDQELEALAPRKSRDIDLKLFVDRRKIPLAMLDHCYVLAPAGESTKAYHLLAATMERQDRAGIATFVMHGREYLAAISASGGLLLAFTLRFAAELRTPRQIGLPPVQKVGAREREEFERVLEKLNGGHLDVALLDDEFERNLRELAELKAAAGDDVIEVAAADVESAETGTDGAEIIDIMAVLRSRIGAGRSDGLEKLSKQALYERAQRVDLPGRSEMSKAELIAALRSAR